MFDPIIQLQRFTRDLLEIKNERLILRGRINEDQANNELDYIAIDSINRATPTIVKESYDYDNEIITYAQRYSQVFTFDFYGRGAFDNASRFVLLINSYISQRLQMKYNITVGSTSGITDIKQLTGQQYINRLQVELTAQYEKEISQELYRIESAEIEVKHDK